MNRAVGADTLNAAETRRFVEAIDLMRAAKVADSVHSAPIRDGADRLVEVRFYSDSNGQHPIGVVHIAADGSLGRFERL